MRIAIDARELHGKPTGVGRFLAQVLAAWKSIPEAQTHEFILFAPDDDGGTWWEQVTLPGLVREARADVLFSPGYSGPILSPVPLVVAIHDVSFAAHPEWFAWREGARRRTIVRLAARAAAKVVTISEFSKREIASHLGIDPAKIVVAYPGVTRLAAHENSDTSHSLLFVGSIFNRRHVPELIRAFSRMARCRSGVSLEIVGDNRTSPRIDLADLVQSAQLLDRVRLRSYVSDDELRSLYGGASAFVFLSEYEGFGLTPVEALAAGLPVVLLDTPAAREICGDAALYVTRPDEELIAKALETIVFDAAERERILASAPRVLDRYSWTVCARQVLGALTEGAHA